MSDFYGHTPRGWGEKVCPKNLMFLVNLRSFLSFCGGDVANETSSPQIHVGSPHTAQSRGVVLRIFPINTSMDDCSLAYQFVVAIYVPQTIRHTNTVLPSMKGSTKAPLHPSAANPQ